MENEYSLLGDKLYKLSVIIPIYNAEKYLENTINSVINQTFGFNKIELILIDDCSTDDSKKIIQKYSKKYPNILPIYLKENHGHPGYGRNIGISNSTAEYIMFLDNDDEYDSNICKTLYETIIKEDSDLVDCDYIILDNISNEFTNLNNTNYIETITEDIIYFPKIYIWTKIFKKSIIINNNIKYITDDVNEDSLFCLEYFMHSKKINYLPMYIGYIHYMHGSNLSTITYKYTFEILKSYYNIYNLIKEYTSECNLKLLFSERIQSTIQRSILMEDFTYTSMKNILKELFFFEKHINFKGISLENPLINFLNTLILNNHIFFTSIIIYILHIISRIKLLRKIYRRIFNR